LDEEEPSPTTDVLRPTKHRDDGESLGDDDDDEGMMSLEQAICFVVDDWIMFKCGNPRVPRNYERRSFFAIP
jgi:hypothetical protein